MQQLDDADLIDLIRNKNEAALEELYDRYHRLIFSIAFNTIQSREEAEEITLDVFTGVWEKAATYDAGKAKVYTWLTRIARNRAIDRIRRENVRPIKHSVAWSTETVFQTTTKDSLETRVVLALDRQKVRDAIHTLSEKQRQVLALAYFGGLSHAEIADELSLPLGTVKGRIRSAMLTLRDCLRED